MARGRPRCPVRTAPAGSVRLESTPFHLHQRPARRRIAEELPDARLVVVVRDPVDRGYSNGMHLYIDGLEPEPDFVAACRAEEERVAAGWAPCWHHRRTDRYGEQLADLFDHVDRERVLVLRYVQLVSAPVETLDTVARFLGIEEGRIRAVPPDSSRGFVRPGLRTEVPSRAIRLGAAAGAYAPPQVWRRASRPLTRALQHGGPDRRPASRPSSGASPSRTAPTTSRCSRTSWAARSTTGAPSRAAVRSPSAWPPPLDRGRRG